MALAAKFVLFGIVAWLRCGIVAIAVVVIVFYIVHFFSFYSCSFGCFVRCLHYSALYAPAVCFVCCSTSLPLNFYFACMCVGACMCVA